MPDRTVNGVRLSYEERGAGEPILLIHGTGGSVPGWGRAVDELAAIAVPTLLVAASDSPEPFRRVTEMMATAMAGSERALVGGGHRLDPADPAVVGFVRRVLG